MKHIISIMLLLFIVSGCKTTGYNQFYQPNFDIDSMASVDRLKSNETPKIFASNDLNTDIKILKAKRYLVVGTSSFNGPYEDTEGAIEQAKDIGATVVLIKSEFTNTESITVPFLLPTSSTTYSSGNAYLGNTYGQYSGETKTYGKTVVPINKKQSRYDQAAVYFAKSNQKMKFGFGLKELPANLKNDLERNSGLLVDIVYENTPAFMANVLVGDVIISIDGKAIYNHQTANMIFKEYVTGQGEIELKVIRGNKIKLLKLNI